jgi:hypothetical protein
MVIARVAEFGDFQAEYEGSIPFTRSKSDFNRCAVASRKAELDCTIAEARFSIRYFPRYRSVLTNRENAGEDWRRLG